MAKVIITAAVTGGVSTPSMSPYLPITPEQIANDAVKAYKAGAAIVHIHARNPETGQPSADVNLFREVITRIRAQCDVIVNTTTGGTREQTAEEKINVVRTLKPEMASLNAGSINMRTFDMAERLKIDWKYPWEKPYLMGSIDRPFLNTFRMLIDYAQVFQQTNTKPEAEIYDSAMLGNVAFLLKKGYIKQPVHLQFVMGTMGGIPATIPDLQFLYETAKRYFANDFTWSLCAVGREQIPICTVAMIMGGNIRVGLEDNLYMSKGALAKSSAEQVERMVRIAGELDIEIASPAEARKVLGLKGLDK